MPISYRFFDIGKADNTFFIVMDFIDGANLKNILEVTKKRGELIPIGAGHLHRSGGL